MTPCERRGFGNDNERHTWRNRISFLNGQQSHGRMLQLTRRETNLCLFLTTEGNLLWSLGEYLAESVCCEKYPMDSNRCRDPSFLNAWSRYCTMWVFVLEREMERRVGLQVDHSRAMKMTRSHSIFLSDKAAWGSFEQHFNACDVWVNVDVSRLDRSIRR